jgi:hypothetical protein
MNEKTQKLYTNLSSQGYKLGTPEEFSAKLSDPVTAEKFYNNITKDGYKLGKNFGEFSATIGLKKKEVSPSVSGGSTPVAGGSEQMLAGEKQEGTGISELAPQEYWRTPVKLTADQIDPKNQKTLLNRTAYNYATKKDYAKSNELITQGLKADPEDPYLNRLAYFNAKKQNDPNLRSFLERAAQTNTEDPVILHDLGVFAFNEGKKEDAYNFAEKALTKVNPTTAEGKRASSSLLGILATIEGQEGGDPTPFLEKKVQLDDKIKEEDEKWYNNPNPANYILSQGVNNSMIGMALKSGLPEGSVNEEFGPYKNHTPSTAEEIGAGVVSLLVDAPMFLVGGAAAGAISKPLITRSVNFVMNKAYQKAIQRGLSKEATELLMKQTAAGALQAITGVSASMAESAGALSVYDATRDVLIQVVKKGKDWEDIDYGQTLKRFGEGAALGMAVGAVGYGTNALLGATTNRLGRAATKATGFAAENAVFVGGGAMLEGKPLSEITGKDWLTSAATLGILKGVGMLKRSVNFTKEKVNQGEFNVELTPEELKAVGEPTTEDAIKNIVSAKQQETIKFERKEIDDALLKVNQERLGLPDAPKVEISKTGENVLNKLLNKEPVLNEDLKTFSDELYSQYKYLNAMKKADTRQFTIEQIDRVQTDVEDLITKLETAKAEQIETGEFTTKLGAILSDPNVPNSAKAKLVWATEGARPENIPAPDRVDVKDNTVQTFDKGGNLLEKKDFEDNVEANAYATQAQAMINDRVADEKAASLTPVERARVLEEVKSSGVDLKTVNDAKNQPPEERSQDGVQALKKFNETVNTVREETITKGGENAVSERTLPENGEQKHQQVSPRGETTEAGGERPVSDVEVGAEGRGAEETKGKLAKELDDQIAAKRQEITDTTNEKNLALEKIGGGQDLQLGVPSSGELGLGVERAVDRETMDRVAKPYDDKIAALEREVADLAQRRQSVGEGDLAQTDAFKEPPTVKGKFQSLADKIRENKFQEGIGGKTSAGVGDEQLIQLWNDALETIAVVVEKTGDVAQAVKDTIASMRTSKEYLALDDAHKKDLRNKFDTVIASVAPEFTKEQRAALFAGEGGQPQKLSNIADPPAQAENVRSYKEELDLFSDEGLGGAKTKPWNDLVETLAVSVEQTGDAVDAIKKTINNFRLSPHYARISESARDAYEKKLWDVWSEVFDDFVVAQKKDIEQNLSKRYGDIEESVFGSKTATEDDFAQSKKTISSILSAPSKAQEATFGKLADVVSDKLASGMSKALASQNMAIRNAAKLVNSIIKDIGKPEALVAKEAEFKGKSRERAAADAQKLTKILTGALGGNKKSLDKLDQVLDPEWYENPIKYEDLAPHEQHVYDLIRSTYDYIHDLNFAMGKINVGTYLMNKGKYSARLYDSMEFPEDIQDAWERGNSSMFTGMYKGREEIDEWKKKHHIANPIHGVSKRLYQTLFNKAIYDYAKTINEKYPDVVSPTERKGFTKLGGGYGDLSNKFVRDDVVEGIKGFFYTNKTLSALNDAFTSYNRSAPRKFYRGLFTKWNPGVQLGNHTGNIPFSMLLGISPMRFEYNFWHYARKEAKNYGPTYRYLLDKGLLRSDLTRTDLAEAWENMAKELDKVVEDPNMFQKLKAIPGKAYSANDDLAKLAAFKSLMDMGYKPEKAVQFIREAYQNFNRVGKFYDFASKMPAIGNMFAKWGGDLFRISKLGITRRPLNLAAGLGTLHLIAYLASVWSGESENERKIREGRPGFPKIPMPNWLGGDIPLAIKIGDTELNLARFVSPLYIYSTPDQDDVYQLFQRFLPVQIPVPSYTTNPSGKGAVWMSQFLKDPIMSPIVQTALNADWKGAPILDPNETIYKQSNLSSTDKAINAVRFLARSYVPYGAYGDDFIRALTGNPDYYGRTKTPGQVALRFIGWNSQQFKEDRYFRTLMNEGSIVDSKLKSLVESAKSAIKARDEGKITPEQYSRREAELLEDFAKEISRMQAYKEKATPYLRKKSIPELQEWIIEYEKGKKK